MKIKPAFAILLIAFGCNTSADQDHASTKTEVLSTSVQDAVVAPSRKTNSVLWRTNVYDSQLGDSIKSIQLNEKLIQSLSDPERAVLGYVATFVGNDCSWDGEANDDFSNLNCKIISALGLGYQCSEQHLGFLRKWFSKDKKALERLQNCPVVPYTATSQDTFDKINLTTNGDTIIVSFEANGINLRTQSSWSWSEENTFVVKGSQLILQNEVKSDVKSETFDMDL